MARGFRGGGVDLTTGLRGGAFACASGGRMLLSCGAGPGVGASGVGLLLGLCAGCRGCGAFACRCPS